MNSAKKKVIAIAAIGPSRVRKISRTLGTRAMMDFDEITVNMPPMTANGTFSAELPKEQYDRPNHQPQHRPTGCWRPRRR